MRYVIAIVVGFTLVSGRAFADLVTIKFGGTVYAAYSTDFLSSAPLPGWDELTRLPRYTGEITFDDSAPIYGTDVFGNDFAYLWQAASMSISIGDYRYALSIYPTDPGGSLVVVPRSTYGDGFIWGPFFVTSDSGVYPTRSTLRWNAMLLTSVESLNLRGIGDLHPGDFTVSPGSASFSMTQMWWGGDGLRGMYINGFIDTIVSVTSVPAVPEPTSWILLGAGVVGCLGLQRGRWIGAILGQAPPC